MGKVKQMISDAYIDFTSHWKKPAKGNYVSYKEVVNYSLGGFSVTAFWMLMGYFSFTVSSYLFGSAIGIRPLHLQYMATMQSILNVFFCTIRGKLVDNTRTRWGRFRPYIAIMGFPIVLIGTIFVWLPFDYMSYNQKLFAVLSFGVVTSMFIALFVDTYGELYSVISPNSNERSKIYTFRTIIGGIPAALGMLVPVFAKYTGGFTDIRTYRWILAPFSLIGVWFALFAAFGCRERVVTSKSYVQKIGLFEGMKHIYRNKYWWIRTITGSLAFLEAASAVLFGWIYIYGTQDMDTYALLQLIMGIPSVLVILITAKLLKRVGNRELLLWHNSLNVVFITLMLLTFKNPILFFLFLLLNGMVNSLTIIYDSTMAAEVKDYTQYQCGRRMDFMFGAAGQIFLPLTIGLGYVMPFVYEGMGLTTNYDTLYDPFVRNKLFSVLCIVSIAGAIINLIPFFFYRMSRQKHEQIIAVLKYRAVMADCLNGTCSPYEIKEVVDNTKRAYEIMAEETPNLKAIRISLAKSIFLPFFTKKQRAYKKEEFIKYFQLGHKAKVILAEKEGVEEIFMAEMTKFDKPAMKEKIAMSKVLTAIPIEEIENSNLHFEPPTDHSARKTHDKFIDSYQKMKKKIKKNYPYGIVSFDQKTLDDALDMPRPTKEANKLRNQAIKKAEKDMCKYQQTVRPYLDAKELLFTYHNKDNYAFVLELYEESCAKVAQQELIEEQREIEIKAERKAELERLRAERASRKQRK